MSNIDPKSNLFFWLALFGLVAPVVTFSIAISGLAAQTKTALLAAIAAAYSAAFLFAYSRSKAGKHADRDNTGVSLEHFGPAQSADISVQTISDPVTGLPNERAMMLVLEYQLAECQRDRDERPLSFISIAFRDFAEFRKEYGEVIANRALRFTANSIRSHLRSMDFLGGVVPDEFGLILPKADRKSASDALSRIVEGLRTISFSVDSNQEVSIEVDLGIATFWEDGETAEQLVRHAQLQRQRARAEQGIKAAEPADEYVH